ncbi:MAG: VOC family protein [Holosporaceae bacterium]
MQYVQTILYVKDVAKTLAFYESAFGFKMSFQSDCGNYATVDVQQGQMSIAFCQADFVAKELDLSFKTALPHETPFGCELCFATPTVEESFKKAVNAGAIAVRKPQPASWGGLLAYVRDNNGFLVSFTDPMPAAS